MGSTPPCPATDGELCSLFKTLLDGALERFSGLRAYCMCHDVTCDDLTCRANSARILTGQAVDFFWKISVAIRHVLV
jgi:hypothetical protein